MCRASLLPIAIALVATFADCGSDAPGRGAAATARPVQPSRHVSPPRRPTSGPHPARQVTLTGARDGDDDDEAHASRTQVSSARSVASVFFTTYLAYLYGQLPARNIAGTARGLSWQLEHGHAITTPAERASPPHIVRLSLSSSGPPISVTAFALVNTADSQPSLLTATLEPHHGTWLVVAITG